MTHERAREIGFNSLLAIVICLTITAIPAARSVHASSYTVDSLGDEHDTAALDGSCSTSLGTCTLRAAIESTYGAGDTINFDGSLYGGVITLHEQLVLQSSNVTIDGNGNDITISGSSISHAPGVPGECLVVAGNGDLIEDLTIRDCPTWGIRVGEHSNNGLGDSNTIYGVTLLGNSSGGIAFSDVDLDGYGGNHSTLDYSLIGSDSSSPSSCNPFDGNGFGVALSGVHGDYIQHSSILCNNLDGINSSGSDTNTLHGNTIGGNLWEGIYLTGTSYTNITGNYIGTIMGTAAFGNAYNGIRMEGSSHAIDIGGSEQLNGNLISGNIQSGIFITDASYDIFIDNNAIGTDVFLDGALPNGNAGIAIVNNTIGAEEANRIEIGSSSVSTAQQYISGNAGEGIYLLNSNNIAIRVSNLIGRGDYSSVIEIPLGNGLEGINILSSPNIIVQSYVIAFNGGAGIAVTGTGSQNNLLGARGVYSNRGLPIDLNYDGHTPNDPGDGDSGPNTLLNYPEVTGISGDLIYGTSCNSCWVYLRRASGDPSAPGGGYSGNPLAVVQANASGYWQTAYPLTGGALVQSVALMAMDSAYNTSELSPRPVTYIPFVKK